MIAALDGFLNKYKETNIQFSQASSHDVHVSVTAIPTVAQFINVCASWDTFVYSEAMTSISNARVQNSWHTSVLF